MVGVDMLGGSSIARRPVGAGCCVLVVQQPCMSVTQVHLCTVHSPSNAFSQQCLFLQQCILPTVPLPATMPSPNSAFSCSNAFSQQCLFLQQCILPTVPFPATMHSPNSAFSCNITFSRKCLEPIDRRCTATQGFSNAAASVGSHARAQACRQSRLAHVRVGKQPKQVSCSCTQVCKRAAQWGAMTSLAPWGAASHRTTFMHT